MKYGNYSLLFQDSSFQDKDNAYANLGDNIIALAIDNIYQTIGIAEENIIYVNKDGTRDYKGEYIGVAFLFKPLIKTDNYIASGHVTQGAELYKQIRGCGIYWVLSNKVPTSPPPCFVD